MLYLGLVSILVMSILAVASINAAAERQNQTTITLLGINVFLVIASLIGLAIL
jgi:hypothetical protein